MADTTTTIGKATSNGHAATNGQAATNKQAATNGHATPEGTDRKGTSPKGGKRDIGSLIEQADAMRPSCGTPW